MKHNLIILLLSVISVHTFSQTKASFDAKHLKLTWETLENNYNNTSETYSTIRISNTSNVAFPEKDWVIYFNSPDLREINNDKPSNLMIKQINGDFFKIYPSANFKGITAGNTLEFDVLTRSLKNITDYPKGFYIVLSDDSKAVSLAYETKTSIDFGKNDIVLAEKIFDNNQKIKNTALDQLMPIIPSPLSYQKMGGNFVISKDIKIISNSLFENEANYLKEELEKVVNFKLVFGKSETNKIIALERKELEGKEAYELKITSEKILISASSNAGIFYGIQSLKLLFPPNSWAVKTNSISVPTVEIKDEPRFGHRAFMLDIARNFQNKIQILKVLDVLSLYKINVLHMHFNDDEGWRIEIPDLPELTEVGSKRGHTITEKDHLIPSYGSGPNVINQSGSGYLTKADYIEILKYATIRHIKVIPEFETPGHARAAIKSMNARYDKFMKMDNKEEAEKYHLRDIYDQSIYRSIQGFDDNVINPALPSVYTFIEKLIDEMLVMYKEAGAPLNTIHFGGDEVPEGVWEKSPLVKELIQNDKSITSVDELWFYYFSKVNQILKARNLYLSGWEEIGLRKAEVNGRKMMVLDPRFVNENFHTDVWNNLHGNEDLAYKLANVGYKVVLTNVTNMYLDLAYNQSYQEPGQYWGGYVDVEKPYSFIPFNYYKNQKENERGEALKLDHFNGKDKLTEGGKMNIVGIQAPLWSEIITTSDRLEYLLLPKLFGLTERSWAKDPEWATELDSTKSENLYNKAWSDFVNVISKNELQRLDNYAGGFNYRIPTAGVKVENGKIKANVQFPDLIIRYTLDGSEPTLKSKIYTEEIIDSGKVSFKVFNKSGKSGNTVRLF
jgi:hexosaminidase